MTVRELIQLLGDQHPELPVTWVDYYDHFDSRNVPVTGVSVEYVSLGDSVVMALVIK